MTYALLRYEAPSLSPETRWLLWRWARCIGLDRAVTCSVRALVEQLGITLRQGQAALNRLKAQGVIIATSKPAGRGRPHYEYRLSSALLESLAACDEAAPSLAADIDRLGAYFHQAVDVTETTDAADDAQDTTVGDPPDQQSRHFSLSLANRWVLMVLLAHANENGTVMDMPALQMQRLAGITSSRWQSQRRKLHEMGVLARYQAGRPERWHGRSLPVVHHLDLSHPCLARPSAIGIQVALFPSSLSGVDTSRANATLAALMAKAHANSSQQKKAYIVNDTLGLLHFSDDELEVVRSLPNSQGTKAWLQTYVHEATIQLLSKKWQTPYDQQEGYAPSEDSVLKSLEQALVHPVIALGAEQMNTGEAEYRATWARLLYILAYDLARLLSKSFHENRVLLSERGLDLSKLTYVILGTAVPASGCSLGKELRHWRLCGYADHYENETPAPLEPVTIVLRP